MQTETLTYKMILSYDGTRFKGWQKGNGRTVQDELEKAIGASLGTASHGKVPPREQVDVVGSGRTDAGVHAEAQVASVWLEPLVDPRLLFTAVNARLSDDLALLSIEKAESRFHARYHAVSKTYRYRIVDGPVGNPFLFRYSWRIGEVLDEVKIREAAAALIGKYDCTSFTSDKGKKDKERTLFSIEVKREKGYLDFYFKGDGFLWNQVRILAAVLVEAGQGKRDAEAIKTLIAERSRALAPAPAPAAGLCLVDVEY